MKAEFRIVKRENYFYPQHIDLSREFYSDFYISIFFGMKRRYKDFFKARKFIEDLKRSRYKKILKEYFPEVIEEI